MPNMPNTPNTETTEDADSEEQRRKVQEYNRAYEEQYRKTREYNRAYYKANKEHIVSQVIARTQLIRGSDAFRAKLVEDLNSGKRKFVKQTTRDMLHIQQDPRTMLWI